jgi:hypothetical protein
MTAGAHTAARGIQKLSHFGGNGGKSALRANLISLAFTHLSATMKGIESHSSVIEARLVWQTFGSKTFQERQANCRDAKGKGRASTQLGAAIGVATHRPASRCTGIKLLMSLSAVALGFR